MALARRWSPDLLLGAAVLLLGLVEAANTDLRVGQDREGLARVAVLTAVAVSLCRRAPAVALALAWVLGGLHLVTGTQAMAVELALVAVSFGTARWGRPGTVVAGGMSIPCAAAAGLVVLSLEGYDSLTRSPFGRSLAEIYRSNGTGDLTTTVAAAGSVLAGPWLAGLAVRFAFRARESQASQAVAEEETARALRQSEQAQEIARLRDDQARLARDVHDVVGHSLAVILAQAESAQYLPEDETDKLKQTMATIATSARSSLQDVRSVLTPHAHADATPRPLDTLVDGVRASGHEVVSRELGTPQPLPPELEVVAYRVLQEMLTNAVKHGRRDEPVFVERHWPDGAFTGELRIEVRNAAAGGTSDGGQGLDGMRDRLDAAAGRLDVRRREEDDAVTFTVTAWLPVSSR